VRLLTGSSVETYRRAVIYEVRTTRHASIYDTAGGTVSDPLRVRAPSRTLRSRGMMDDSRCLSEASSARLWGALLRRYFIRMMVVCATP
jgi:hypothetical protein